MAWSRAVVVSLAVLVAAYVTLAFVPDLLLTRLSGRVAPLARDLLVGVWTVAAVAAMTWLLVQAQGKREERK
jgi:type VI protein secretion system component VasK